MSLTKDLPLRPKSQDFNRAVDYASALENYADALEKLINTKKEEPKAAPKRTEGWLRPSASRKFHYYVDGRSLCRSWGFPDETQLEADTGNKEKGKEDCTVCFHKLVDRRTKLGVDKID